jgi:hypothetical protein
MGGKYTQTCQWFDTSNDYCCKSKVNAMKSIYIVLLNYLFDKSMPIQIGSSVYMP